MADRKRMKKVRVKRIDAMRKQVDEHKYKIETEKPRKDTTIPYWQNEIDKKFAKKIKEDEEYLEENK